MGVWGSLVVRVGFWGFEIETVQVPVVKEADHPPPETGDSERIDQTECRVVEGRRDLGRRLPGNERAAPKVQP